MSFLNPIQILSPIILMTISVPLFIFASITTYLALATLFLRAFIVYLELATALVHSWLVRPSKPLPPLPLSASTVTARPTTIEPPSTAITSSSQRKPHGRPSSSHQKNPPASQKSKRSQHRPTKSDPNASFAPMSTTPTDRDFEGVGGWCDPGPDNDEALWMGMNARLQLPAMAMHDSATRHHRRSLTASGASPRNSGVWDSYGLRMSSSPGQSRPRTRAGTPSAMVEIQGLGTGVPGGVEGYFSLTPVERVGASTESLRMTESDRRRLSLRTTSTGSSESVKSIVKIVKTTSFD